MEIKIVLIPESDEEISVLKQIENQIYMAKLSVQIGATRHSPT